MSWGNKIIGTADVPPTELLARPDNWRMHPEYQRNVMVSALTEIGWLQHVVVSRASGRIIDGHLRVHLAQQNAEPTVPVVYVDLSEDEERAALASLDAITGLAEIDPDALARLVSGIEVQETALATLFESLATDAAVITKATQSADKPDGRTKGMDGAKSAPRVKVVIAVSDSDIFERAIRAAGTTNRGQALLRICEAFIHGRPEGQHDAGPQGFPASFAPFPSAA